MYLIELIGGEGRGGEVDVMGGDEVDGWMDGMVDGYEGYFIPEEGEKSGYVSVGRSVGSN